MEHTNVCKYLIFNKYNTYVLITRTWYYDTRARLVTRKKRRLHRIRELNNTLRLCSLERIYN